MKNKSIFPLANTSERTRNAPVVEQVEEMPALMKSNFVPGNRFWSHLATIGRYPFICVMEPPINATRPVFSLSNCNCEFA